MTAGAPVSAISILDGRLVSFFRGKGLAVAMEAALEASARDGVWAVGSVLLSRKVLVLTAVVAKASFEGMVTVLLVLLTLVGATEGLAGTIDAEALVGSTAETLSAPSVPVAAFVGMFNLEVRAPTPGTITPFPTATVTAIAETSGCIRPSDIPVLAEAAAAVATLGPLVNSVASLAIKKGRGGLRTLPHGCPEIKLKVMLPPDTVEF